MQGWQQYGPAVVPLLFIYINIFILLEYILYSPLFWFILPLRSCFGWPFYGLQPTYLWAQMVTVQHTCFKNKCLIIKAPSSLRFSCVAILHDHSKYIFMYLYMCFVPPPLLILAGKNITPCGRTPLTQNQHFWFWFFPPTCFIQVLVTFAIPTGESSCAAKHG